MILKKLKLNNFRNYRNLDIEFSPDINLISGNNGSGKTNILEAVSIISNLKSFRQSNDSVMKMWSSDHYYCRGEAEGLEFSLFEVGFYRDMDHTKKKIKIDGSEIRKVSEYYGNLITVPFIPADINIPGGSPDLKRRYIDSVISKLYPEYIDHLNRFRDILNSRNTLLKKIKDGECESGQVDIWDRLFAEKANLIISRRRNFMEFFSDIFQNSYKAISGESDPPYIKYRPSMEDNSVDYIYGQLKRIFLSDIRKGNTGYGPQRDDYVFLNNEGINFLDYASQGQRRTAAISLKIAEYEIIKKIRNKKSIILIDDIFSELDEKRRLNMIDLLIKEGQLILTMVNKEIFSFDKSFPTRFFHVDNGNII